MLNIHFVRNLKVINNTTTQKQIILRKEYKHKYYETCFLANYKAEKKSILLFF